LFLPIIDYTLSTTKLDLRTKYFLLGIKGVEGRGRGLGNGGNDPNIVCTYE
jgi:hypothetical protein